MKKLYYLALCLLSMASFGQTNSNNTKATYSQLPFSYYPTKILHNSSLTYFWSWDIDTNLQWQLNPDYQGSPYKFPGDIPAPLVTRHQWAMLYNEMYTSAMDSMIIPKASILNQLDSIEQLLYDVPVGAMHLNFHRVMPGAVDSGYLYYDTLTKTLHPMPDTLWISKQNDVYQYNPNPDSLARLGINEYELFAGVLTNSVLYLADSVNTVVFGLASNLFISNQVETITYM